MHYALHSAECSVKILIELYDKGGPVMLDRVAGAGALLQLSNQTIFSIINHQSLN